MGTSRMYADENGDTTWEPIDLEQHAEWLKGFDAKTIKFGKRPPNVVQDWHPAPARQFVIILSGQLQITYPDGSKRVFGPGEARLMDNVTVKELKDGSWETGPNADAINRFAEQFNQNFNRVALGSGPYMLLNPEEDLITGQKVVITRDDTSTTLSGVGLSHVWGCSTQGLVMAAPANHRELAVPGMPLVPPRALLLESPAPLYLGLPSGESQQPDSANEALRTAGLTP